MNGLRHKPTILVCDTQAARLQGISRAVEEGGARLATTDSHSPDAIPGSGSPGEFALALVAVDADLGGPAALRFIRRLSRPSCRVVCFGELSSWPVGRRCRLLLEGASRLLDSGSPSFDLQLRQLIRHSLTSHLDRHEEHEEDLRLAERLGIVGRSRAMMSVLAWVRKISVLSDLQVLITGQTGTGKEVIALALHRCDPKRSAGPFVALNCSTVSATLAESELFGHQRGSFTGGDTRREGAFRAAEKGVLFLDEIGEIPLPLQPKLLRVLQEGKVRAVGDDRETAIDVRVIAATHRDLAQMIERGEFRADLFHRLSVLQVHLPPLHARREDTEPLVRHFLQKHAALRPDLNVHLQSEYLDALTELDLPGNVRQLENLVRWTLVNKADDAPLGLSDLPAAIWAELASRDDNALSDSLLVAESPPSDFPSQLESVMQQKDWSLTRAMEYCEALMLKSVLRRAGHNQAEAARMMGITARSVHNKMRKHQLRPRRG